MDVPTHTLMCLVSAHPPDGARLQSAGRVLQRVEKSTSETLRKKKRKITYFMHPRLMELDLQRAGRGAGTLWTTGHRASSGICASVTFIPLMDLGWLRRGD